MTAAEGKMIIIETKGIDLAESKNDPMVEQGPVYRALMVDGKAA